MGNTKTDKYPDGYSKKIDYWNKELLIAIQGGHETSEAVATRKLKYFLDKQSEWEAKKDSEARKIFDDLRARGQFTYNYGISGITLSGGINELKDMVIDLYDAIGEDVELSGSLQDMVFAIEADYQGYHSLDQDNWDKVH